MTTLAWPVAGAAVGFSIGVLVSAKGRSTGVVLVALSILVAGLVGLALLVVARAARRARANRPAKRAGSLDSVSHRGPLFVEIELPDSVWGVGEPLEVRVRVAREGALARGADVALSLGLGGSLDSVARSTASRIAVSLRPLARGPTDADGVFAHPLVMAEPGALRLDADATLEGLATHATRALRIVRWNEEIQKLFVDFRVWAARRVPDLGESATAREVVTALSMRPLGDGSKRALDEIARIYEIVAYGARPADRSLYLSVRDGFRALEAAGFFEEASPFA
ncbi:MAG: DUF4129 domain-containing protein [Thermoplasmatota archaeon]